MPIKNEIGNRYGKLLVIEQSGYIKRDVAWKCRCDCGNIKIARGTSLRIGSVQSCGCLYVENKWMLPPGEAAFNFHYSHIRHGAILRGYSWNLTKEQVIQIEKQNCFYCGTKPNQKIIKGKSSGVYIYNGIDRINNDVGYEIDNCVPCCGICNKMKNKHSVDDFKTQIKNIYEHFVSH